MNKRIPLKDFILGFVGNKEKIRFNYTEGHVAALYLTYMEARAAGFSRTETIREFSPVFYKTIGIENPFEKSYLSEDTSLP